MKARLELTRQEALNLLQTADVLEEKEHQTNKDLEEGVKEAETENWRSLGVRTTSFVVKVGKKGGKRRRTEKELASLAFEFLCGVRKGVEVTEEDWKLTVRDLKKVWKTGKVTG